MSENNNSTETLGMSRVGISFNPSGDERVISIKQKAASLIDEIKVYSDASDNDEAKRVFALAMTEIESASRWAVTGITKK
jgi:acetolactate synthase small subunit